MSSEFLEVVGNLTQFAPLVIVWRTLMEAPTGRAIATVAASLHTLFSSLCDHDLGEKLFEETFTFANYLLTITGVGELPPSGIVGTFGTVRISLCTFSSRNTDSKRRCSSGRQTSKCRVRKDHSLRGGNSITDSPSTISSEQQRTNLTSNRC
jgi:hypothetical protein